MMNKSMDMIELSVLQHIFQTRDERLLILLDKNWFKNGKYALLVQIWKDNPINLDPIQLANTVKGKNEEFISTDDIIKLSDRDYLSYYENPIDGFQSAVAILEDEYKKELILREFENVKTKIGKYTSDELSMELINFVQSLQTKEEREGSLLDGFEQTNELVINIGGLIRPALNNILPRKKSIITIGGYSGHHKSNQVIDILLSILDSNPGQKVLFFSIEMDSDEVRDRLLARLSRVDVKSIMRRKCDVKQIKEYVTQKFQHIIRNFIIISPLECKTMKDVAKFVIRYKPLAWGFDYLQYFALIQSGNSARDQNAHTMETITDCKITAQLTDSLAVIVSQLRKRDNRSQTWFPRVDDLEWSGLTIQLSHSIGLCFWPHKVINNIERMKREYYCVSWEKVRNGDPFPEFMHVQPELCSFNSQGGVPKTEADKILNM